MADGVPFQLNRTFTMHLFSQNGTWHRVYMDANIVKSQYPMLDTCNMNASHGLL